MEELRLRLRPGWRSRCLRPKRSSCSADARGSTSRWRLASARHSRPRDRQGQFRTRWKVRSTSRSAFADAEATTCAVAASFARFTRSGRSLLRECASLALAAEAIVLVGAGPRLPLRPGRSVRYVRGFCLGSPRGLCSGCSSMDAVALYIRRLRFRTGLSDDLPGSRVNAMQIHNKCGNLRGG